MDGGWKLLRFKYFLSTLFLCASWLCGGQVFAEDFVKERIFYKNGMAYKWGGGALVVIAGFEGEEEFEKYYEGYFSDLSDITGYSYDIFDYDAHDIKSMDVLIVGYNGLDRLKADPERYFGVYSFLYDDFVKGKVSDRCFVNRFSSKDYKGIITNAIIAIDLTLGVDLVHKCFYAMANYTWGINRNYGSSPESDFYQWHGFLPEDRRVLEILYQGEIYPGMRQEEYLN